MKWLQGVILNIFIINIALIGFWALILSPSSKERNRIPFVVIISIQLFIIAAGSPIVNDAVAYEMWAATGYYGNSEIGWIYLSKVLWAIWPTGKCLLLGVTSISLLSFARFFLKYSKSLPLSYLIYIALGLWGFTFYIFRQSIAIAIILFAYDAIIEKRPLKFALIVGAATLFHQTSAAFILAYPLLSMKRDRALRVIIELAIIVTFTLLSEQILTILLSVFRNGAIYSLSDEVEGFGYFLMLLVSTVFMYIIDRPGRDSEFQKGVELATVFQTASFRFPLFVRLVNYYSLSLSIALPNSLARIEEQKLKPVVYFAVIVALLLLYVVFQDCCFPGGPDAYVFTWG